MDGQILHSVALTWRSCDLAVGAVTVWPELQLVFALQRVQIWIERALAPSQTSSPSLRFLSVISLNCSRKCRLPR